MISRFSQALDPGFLQWGALGIGGVLAGVIFYFYREDRKASEDRLQKMHEACEARLNAITDDFRLIVQENTAASQKLTDLITLLLAKAGGIR